MNDAKIARPDSPPRVLDPERPLLWLSADVARWTRRAAFALAAAAALFMWLEEQFAWLDYRPGGAAFFSYVRPVFYGLLVLGALLAVKWEIAGGVVGAFAAGAISAFAVNQLVGRHAIFVICLLAVPALLWAIVDLNDQSARIAMIGLTVAGAAVVGGSVVGETLYEGVYGPTHPASEIAALPESEVRWIWSGGVSSTGAEVRARTERDDVNTLRLAVTPSDDFADATWFDVDTRDGAIAEFDAGGLEPATTYRYAIEVDGEIDNVRAGVFTTFPVGPASFRFTVGACARVGSNGSVFDAIVAENPLLHLIAGDFHYGDIPDDTRDRYDDVIDLTLRQPAQARLYLSTPVAYVWDDHDYGANNSNSFSTSRVAAMQAYRANVPSYELAGELTPIYQSFDVGRVRFILTDARSGREPGTSMLGQEQLDWFLDELVRAADEQALVVWLNPVPWVSEASEGADDWAGYADERRLIANVIAENEIRNLLMVSGDAHMVAIDDGTNTDYSDRGGAGFPLIHAAALDRPGTTKGGPYSEGAIGGGGQYAVVDVTDEGGAITIDLAAKRWDGEVLISYSFEVPSG